MIPWLFLCSGCDNEISWGTFFCPSCKKLPLCPKLCARCTEPECFCSDSTILHSVQAVYLTEAMNRAPIIRLKKSPSLLLKSLLFSKIKIIPNVKAIIPIPQRQEKAFQYGLSLSEKLSHHLSKKWSIPYVEALTIKSHHQEIKTLNKTERYLSTNPFLIVKNIPDSVLLVDDFITTGSTLKNAAKILSSHTKEIHGFALAKNKIS